jgi:hypothetical protein
VIPPNREYDALPLYGPTKLIDRQVRVKKITVGSINSYFKNPRWKDLIREMLGL